MEGMSGLLATRRQKGMGRMQASLQPGFPGGVWKQLWPSFTASKMLLRSDCPAAAAAKSLQSCPTLCNPVDGSPLGSSAPGILQARILDFYPLLTKSLSIFENVPLPNLPETLGVR